MGVQVTVCFGCVQLYVSDVPLVSPFLKHTHVMCVCGVCVVWACVCVDVVEHEWPSCVSDDPVSDVPLVSPFLKHTHVMCVWCVCVVCVWCV